jgi:hypothetical protein
MHRTLPIMFADGRVVDVSVAFLQQCETLTMFEALPAVCDACEPVSIPGLSFDRHARLLAMISDLDERCIALDAGEAQRVYDEALDTLDIPEMFALLHAADYLQHGRALASCARVIAGRVRGKSRREMLDVMGLQESPERMQLMDAGLSWVIPDADVRKFPV